MLPRFFWPTRCMLAGAFAFFLLFHCSAAHAQTAFTVSSVTGQCSGPDMLWQLAGASGTMQVNMELPPSPCETPVMIGQSLSMNTLIGLGNYGNGTVNGTAYQFYYEGAEHVTGGFFLGSPLTDFTVVVPVTFSGGPLEACYPGGACFSGPGTNIIPVLFAGSTGTATINFFPEEFFTNEKPFYDVEDVTYQLPPTPEPRTSVLFGTGLLGIFFVMRKRLLA